MDLYLQDVRKRRRQNGDVNYHALQDRYSEASLDRCRVSRRKRSTQIISLKASCITSDSWTYDEIHFNRPFRCEPHLSDCASKTAIACVLPVLTTMRATSSPRVSFVELDLTYYLHRVYKRQMLCSVEVEVQDSVNDIFIKT